MCEDLLAYIQSIAVLQLYHTLEWRWMAGGGDALFMFILVCLEVCHLLCTEMISCLYPLTAAQYCMGRRRPHIGGYIVFFYNESEWHHYGWLMLYSWVHMSFRLPYPVAVFWSVMLIFVDVFCCSVSFVWGESCFRNPWSFILFYSSLSFLLVVTVSFNPVLFKRFNVRWLCKQTKLVSQIIHWTETSVTWPNLDSR